MYAEDIMINALEHQRVYHRPPAISRPKRKRFSSISFRFLSAARKPGQGRSAFRRSRHPSPRPMLKALSFAGRSCVQRIPYRISAVFTEAKKIEIILAGILLVCICIPLVYRSPFFALNAYKLPALESSDVEKYLFQYIIPEEIQDSKAAALDPQLIKSLSLSTYTVKKGDTLSEIARRFKLNLDTVISYNNIRDARALRPGAVLNLPNTNGLKYRVRRGDYLGGIAKKFGVPLNFLLDWNNLQSSVINPGQKLFIPAARLSEHELNRVLGKLFIYPMRGRITSRFGMRKDPLTGVKRFHNGVDLANSVGTPVLAAMAGRVAMTGYNAHFGKYIILSHSEGFQTLYGHLNSFKIRRGVNVKQGQIIGTMGNTGYSTGPHLHFSIFRKGEPVDPFRYLH